MEKYLTEEEIINLIYGAKLGENKAWNELYNNFKLYIYKHVWKRLKKLNVSHSYAKNIKEDLYMAGWQGFVSAIKNFNPEKGKFLPYAKYYIDGEISKELCFLSNPLGLTERNYIKEKENHYAVSRASLDECSLYVNTLKVADNELCDERVLDCSKYSAEERALQILKVLRMLTDEEHSISKDELGKMLSIYRKEKHNNATPLEAPNTFTSTLEKILLELDPKVYSDENDAEYKVKYEGYREDRLKKKINKETSGKSPEITNFSYVHIFNNAELDNLIQLICFSDIISYNEKTQLIRKLLNTASVYYKSPFFNNGKLKFNPKAIHRRFNAKNMNDGICLSENLKIVQQAVNNMCQISFKFNRYTAEHSMIPKTEFVHTLSPYHLVVYHDNYYCIGLKNDDRKIWHYRVDLMSDIEFLKDNDGEIIPIEVSNFGGLPISNADWNPEKYMAEHLNMGYDEPQNIRIKIKNTDYTIIHDWFGNHYEKSKEPCEDGYDIVIVKTSSSMIVHWAMQYGTAVEIIDENIRESIMNEIRKISEMYEK